MNVIPMEKRTFIDSKPLREYAESRARECNVVEPDDGLIQEFLIKFYENDDPSGEMVAILNGSTITKVFDISAIVFLGDGENDGDASAIHLYDQSGEDHMIIDTTANIVNFSSVERSDGDDYYRLELWPIPPEMYESTVRYPILTILDSGPTLENGGIANGEMRIIPNAETPPIHVANFLRCESWYKKMLMVEIDRIYNSIKSAVCGPFSTDGIKVGSVLVLSSRNGSILSSRRIDDSNSLVYMVDSINSSNSTLSCRVLDGGCDTAELSFGYVLSYLTYISNECTFIVSRDTILKVENGICINICNITNIAELQQYITDLMDDATLSRGRIDAKRSNTVDDSHDYFAKVLNIQKPSLLIIMGEDSKGRGFFLTFGYTNFIEVDDESEKPIEK